MAERAVVVNAVDQNVPRFTRRMVRDWIGNRFLMSDAAGRITGQGIVRHARVMDEFGQQAMLTVSIPDHLASGFETDAGRPVKLPFER